MGMAASQARFLGLTARKTNTEYEGQQINQQRTTLSNQSANYYNQLLGMAVPVPPSVADYTKTVYTFTDGALSNSISTMIAQADGKYLISYTSSWVDDFAAVSTASSIVTKDDTKAYPYSVGANTLRTMGDRLTFSATEKDENGNITNIIPGLYYNSEDKKYYRNYNANNKTYSDEYIPEGEATYTCEFANDFNDNYLKTLSPDQIAQLEKEEEEYIKILNEQFGEPKEGWTVRYVENTTTGTWSPIFCKNDVLNSEDTVYSKTGSSLSHIQMYTIGSAQKTEEIKNIEARMEQDATGRIINVTLKPGKPDEVTYAVTTNTVTDQARYDDAMNQYEYDKYQYDQSIQEINAKIEIIQAEDKNLELRLKQLDTEQKAIQTEMEAVSKVVEKNTESSFKTFG